MIKDQHGGSAGGFSDTKTSDPIVSNSPKLSRELSGLAGDASSYRANNGGLSITNRDEFAGKVAYQRSALQTWDKYTPSAGVLLFKYGSGPSLLFGLGTMGVSKSLERGLQGLEAASKRNPCNNCTKSYPVKQP